MIPDNKKVSLKRLKKLGSEAYPDKTDTEINSIINVLCWKNFLIIQKYYTYIKSDGKRDSWNKEGNNPEYRMKFNKNENHNVEQKAELSAIFSK